MIREAAMTEVFVHGVPDMARVFYAAPQEGSEALSFVTWKEPNEGAYTISGPQGWKISGGIRRRTPVDVRSAVNLVSPDGTIHLFIGDYDVPPALWPPA